MTNPNNPWDRSLEESDLIDKAMETVSELSDDDRRLALANINARRRQQVYEGKGSYEPVFDKDGWNSPRWEIADSLTGGVDNGSILSHIPSGSVLDPPPRKEKKPMSRCSRCGCWSTPQNIILRSGVYWCKTCCGGNTPLGV
jgi:hypothetical protein